MMRVVARGIIDGEQSASCGVAVVIVAFRGRRRQNILKTIGLKEEQRGVVSLGRKHGPVRGGRSAVRVLPVSLTANDVNGVARL